MGLVSKDALEIQMCIQEGVIAPIGLPQVPLLTSGQADLNEDVKSEVMGNK